MRRALLACLLFGCLTEPAPNALAALDVVAFDPANNPGDWQTAAYPAWWAEVEACSGLRGDYARVRWYMLADTTARSFPVPWGRASAAYLRDERAVVLVRAAVTNQPVVRHEMLHALLPEPGHPAAFDRCGVRLGAGL